MHPLLFVKEQRKLTWRGMSDRVKRVTGERIRPDLLAQYACGLKLMSPKRADAIHRTFKEIGRESLLYPTVKKVANG